MNLFCKIALSLTASAALTSCSKYESLDYHVDKPASFARQEEIDAYQALKTYINREDNPGFKFGAGVSLSDYTKKGVMYRLINSNFDEIALGYGMKHGAVVQADGSLALDNVKTLLKTASDAGISVYGHTLCWHSNQNATYLNGLIAPEIVESNNNILDLTGLKDGSMNGWTVGGGAGKSIADGEGIDGGKAVKIVSSSTSQNAWDLNMKTPVIPIEQGKKYVISFNIKSDKAGKGRISFSSDLNNQYPWTDWTGSGSVGEAFVTDNSWTQIKFTVSDFKEDATSFSFNFDMGYLPDVTYYIDVNSLSVMDEDASSGLEANLYQNADFEGSQDLWKVNGSGITKAFTADGEGAGGTGRALAVTNPSVKANAYESQVYYRLDPRLKTGDQYKFSMDVRADVETTFGSQYHSDEYVYDGGGIGNVNVSTTWQKIELDITVSASEDVGAIVFDLGKTATTFYFDNVSLRRVNPNGGTQEIEKTPEEKKAIISDALTRWISGMVDSCKPYVKAWDVVNEPMDDAHPYELKTAGSQPLPADQFYWQDYLGMDYAVQAFQLAREHCNEGDLLFINDYNLESNLDKCKGLIEYVQYIESKGAQVDGIGTQMHISTDTDKEKIAEMFRLLAATGKLVRVSELDMGVGDETPTTETTEEQYEAQAEMYKYVIGKYFEIVPAAQRYGITIWSPLDSPAGSSWRPGQPIGLWTEDLVRKPAYTGVADGLAGK